MLLAAHTRLNRNGAACAASRKASAMRGTSARICRSSASTGRGAPRALINLPSSASILLSPAPASPTGPVLPLAGPTLAVTVQTCHDVESGNAVDTPRAATGGAFGAQSATGTAYAQCLVLRWVRLQVVVGGANPTSAFSVTGTGVPLGLS